MLINPDSLYSSESIRKIEALSIQAGKDQPALRVAAVQASLALISSEWPMAKRLLIACGPGLNGADGLLLALEAHHKGLSPVVIGFEPIAPENISLKQEIETFAIPFQIPDQAVLEGDLIVDALFGIGLNRALEDPYRELVLKINNSPIPVLALDVPSGINADTGADYGCAIQADLTLCFIGLKKGLFTNGGMASAGRVYCDDLAIPASLIKQINPSAQLLTWKQMKAYLPRRLRDSHKGCYGHVLVIGGDYGMGGSVRMAAEAAMRVGAGLVTVATRPEHVSVVTAARPELMCHQVVSSKDLLPLLERATVLVVGPGLGQSEWALDLLKVALEWKGPKVLDADCLNLLSHFPEELNESILTPHPGEAARLLGISTHEVQNDRFKAIDELYHRYQSVIVLKGAGSLVKGSSAITTVCRAGNPGMATGGMGDILSGVIASLIAQGLDRLAAAELGVFIHSIAADRAAEEGGERGLIATDLLMHLRRMVNPVQ